MCTNLFDLDLKGLEKFFIKLNEKSFRARQLLQWIHKYRVVNFSEMTNLSIALRRKLQDIAEVKLPKVLYEYVSKDGTCKWIMKLSCGSAIEAVFIPEDRRGTLCVSSQVGCALSCTFCFTAQQGFNRNLKVSEIIGQLWLANGALRKNYDGERVVTNVVMMGMGEPLANYDNVITAMNVMRDNLAYGISWRRLTLSTSGMVPMIDRLSKDCHVSLAISLHAANDELRSKIVPLNNKYPIMKLLSACKRYSAGYKRPHITVEYVLLENINDSVQDANDLVSILRDLPIKINLIPFNSFPGTNYSCSPHNVILRFKQQLINSGLVTTVRKIRGSDIIAACGQLSGSVHDRIKKSQIL
ncbi:MAG: 23S rRNA (adenine(2503)-C(2))-methyltransferase RlmN [Piscirickettsiaceae bacterium]|nr:23S rRNA (adenine(2503)-C(2))-methyltransferase RlmN [Piscirickettsiaceae bacterium]